ncbi:MAG: glycosyl hydrolase family 18 protein [Ginsengibacter sp.]
MRKQILTIAVIITLGFKPQAQVRSENLFYMTDNPQSFESFQNNASQISIVCPQVFRISKEGVLSGTIDPRVLKIAKANKIKVMPLIVNVGNSGFNSGLLHDIVSNPVARKRAVGMMLIYAKQYGLDGWQFDLEGLNIQDRDSFTVFFKEAANALHHENLQMSAALVHAVENVGGTTPYLNFLYEDWRAGYSFKELAEAGDFISIMSYDQHTRRTTPGPVAGKEWVERIIKYLLAEGIPPEKLSLGIPNYSKHWFTDYTEEKGAFSNAQGLGYSAVQYLLKKNDAKSFWNDKAGCNYAVWDNDGVFEYVFIEDAQSLKPKLDLLKKYNLRGISVWVLGSEDPAFWNILAKETKRK